MEKIIDIITNSKFYLPIIYVIVGVILNKIVRDALDRSIHKYSEVRGRDKKKETIAVLGKNVVKYIIVIFVVLEILSIYGVDTRSIIASLGVFAAVIGLAFQDIIKDLLAGIAIILDNKYSVGDCVEINGFKGYVTALGLRTTKIKAFSGEVKSIGNSAFNEVTNYSVSNADIFMGLNVAYDTDIEKLEKVLENMKEDILKIDNVIDYKLLGIDELAGSSIVYMIDVTCKAMTTLGVKRKVLRMVKDTFNKENISIPYTTVDINIRK